MKKNYKKVMKIIVIVCIIVLIIDISYLIYKKFIYKPKVSYFDSINAFEVIEDGYITVGSNNNNKDGYEKAKITKYDNNKEKVWEKLYNKKYNSSYFEIKQDDEYLIAVGDYEANKEERKDNVRSALIVKYDSEGKILNEKRFQVLGDSKFTNLLVVPDGYLVVGQSIYENMTLGLSDKGGAFLIKYDKDLNEVWRSNYGGSKSAIYNDLIILNDNIYAVGKDAVNTGIISKYNMNGERLITTNYSYTDSFGFTSITSIDNNLYVIGAKKVDKDKSSYDTDSLIVKYDLDCNNVNEVTYKGKGIERFNKAIVDNDKIIIAGQTGIYNKEKSSDQENIFSYNGIFAIYDSNLKKLELTNYQEETDDYFTDIAKKDNTYIISGYSTYEENDYISKLITYTTSGKLIGEE